MNDRKLNQLFRAARQDQPPVADADFEARVLRALRQPEAGTESGSVSLWEQLSGLFPRVAGVAAMVIVLCVALDYGLSSRATADLTDDLTELSEQWLFAAN